MSPTDSTASPYVNGTFLLTCAMTSPPRARTASMAAGSTFTSVPSDTVASTGGDVCISTTSGGIMVASITGIRESRQGKYLSRSLPRMPGPMNGDSRITPSRSGTPGCAFSMHSRYSATAASSTARACHGVAKLPPATTRGTPGSAPSTAPSRDRDTMRTRPLSRTHRWFQGLGIAAGAPCGGDRATRAPPGGPLGAARALPGSGVPLHESADRGQRGLHVLGGAAADGVVGLDDRGPGGVPRALVGDRQQCLAHLVLALGEVVPELPTARCVEIRPVRLQLIRHPGKQGLDHVVDVARVEGSHCLVSKFDRSSGNA